MSQIEGEKSYNNKLNFFEKVFVHQISLKRVNPFMLDLTCKILLPSFYFICVLLCMCSKRCIDV